MVCVRSAQESITLKCDRPFRGWPRLVQWNTYSTIEAGNFKMIKFANSTHFQARPQYSQFPFSFGRTFNVYGIHVPIIIVEGLMRGLFSPHMGPHLLVRVSAQKAQIVLRTSQVL